MSSKSHVPLKLLKNTSYPTYQLHCKIENTRTPVRVALTLAILETMAWIRTRLREFEIPEELNFDDPELYDENKEYNFKSFRINEGYIITVIYIDEIGSWTLHLIEPDLGPNPGAEKQAREPVAGRLFETNISYRIVNNEVECGFKTVCSDIAGTNVECEVYRLAVVKKIRRNKSLGLKHIVPIKEVETVLDSKDKIEKAYYFMKNNDRQMPMIIVGPTKINPINIDAIIPTFNPTKNIFESEFKDHVLAVDKQEKPRDFDITQLAKDCVGFAQVYSIPYDYLESYNKTFDKYPVSHGDIRIIYPLRFYDESDTYKNENIVKRKMQEYTKGKLFSFSNIKFINDARIEEREVLTKKSSDVENLLNLEIERSEGLYGKLREVQYESQAKDEIIKELRRKIGTLKQQIDDIKLHAISEQKQLEDKHAFESKKKEFLIEHIKGKLQRPKTTIGIVDWVNETFKGKLVFNDIAAELIRKTPQEQFDIELLCDAIECIACEWRDLYMGKIKEVEMNEIMSMKYNRPFEISPSGFVNLQQYSKAYKAKIWDPQTKRMREQFLNWHLKVGKNKNPLRIYFLFDEATKTIVIGSLPKHLPICSIES